MHLVVAVQDRALGDFAKRLEQLGATGRAALSSALNAAGEEVRLLTVAAETKQTGLDGKTIAKAQKTAPSTPASLSFRIRSQGGNVRLKFFGARETSGGVVAHPLGEAQVFAHAFMKGGRFPDRSVGKLNGQVFERAGAGRLPIRIVRSGVAIPKEMVTGATAAAFDKGVATIVTTAVVSRLGALLP